MPGIYPIDAECCIWEDEAAGIDCARRVEHSFAIEGPDGILRYFFCEHHWRAGAGDVAKLMATKYS